MKINKLTKAVLATTLAASIVIPIIISDSSIMSYSASTKPFCEDTDNNGSLNIDDSQINVNVKKYYPAGQNIKVKSNKTEDGIFFSSNTKINNIRMFDRSIITLRLKGTNLTKDNLDKFKITVTYYYQGTQSKITYDKPLIDVVDETNNEYELKYDIISRGEAFEFTTTALSDIDEFSCTQAYMSPKDDAGDYYQVDVKTPNGENVFISIKNDGTVKAEYMKKWAKRICMYINSLSKMTGIKHETFFICFNHPTNPGVVGYSANWDIDEQMNKYGFVAIGFDASNIEIERMRNGYDELTWTVMHEIAHSYCIGAKPVNYDSNYSFDDDYVTNIRGITAIQNCDNLHGTKILFEFGGRTYYNTYDKIFSDMKEYINLPVIQYPCGFAKIARDYSWETLEKFFAATSDNDINRKESKDAAQLLNAALDMNVPLSSDLYIRFVNNLRKLQSLCWNGYNKYSFISFVDQYFGLENICGLIQDLITRYYIIL